jgi:hypothetical protein
MPDRTKRIPSVSVTSAALEPKPRCLHWPPPKAARRLSGACDSLAAESHESLAVRRAVRGPSELHRPAQLWRAGDGVRGQPFLQQLLEPGPVPPGTPPPPLGQSVSATGAGSSSYRCPPFRPSVCYWSLVQFFQSLPPGLAGWLAGWASRWAACCQPVKQIGCRRDSSGGFPRRSVLASSLSVVWSAFQTPPCWQLARRLWVGACGFGSSVSLSVSLGFWASAARSWLLPPPHLSVCRAGMRVCGPVGGAHADLRLTDRKRDAGAERSRGRGFRVPAAGNASAPSDGLPAQRLAGLFQWTVSPQGRGGRGGQVAMAWGKALWCALRVPQR